MSDEIKHSEEETPSPGKKSNQKKPGVGLYLVILFIAAFLLLLMAYFMQQRAADAQTINTLRESITSIESLDALIEENQALRDEVGALNAKTEELETALEEQQEQLQALQDSEQALLLTVSSWEAFYQVDDLYQAKDYEACAELIKTLYHGGDFSVPLPAAERFAQIEAALNNKGYDTQV